MSQQGEVVLGRLTAPGVPDRDIVLRGGALFAGADPVSPQRLAGWDRAGHFAWASPNMHDVFYGQHPQVADSPAVTAAKQSGPFASTPASRRPVVWLHAALAASSAVLALLLVLLLGLRAFLGAMLSGGQNGVAAVTIAGGLVSAAAFLGGWSMMRQASKDGAPRAAAVTPLGFAIIVITGILLGSPRSSLGAGLLSVGVPVTLAAVAMSAGALAADPKAPAGRTVASRLATLGLTLVVAMSSFTLAAASTPPDSQGASSGLSTARSGGIDGSASPSDDQRAQAEAALPGWKVERVVSTGDSTCFLLGSSSAPTVHLVLLQQELDTSSLSVFADQPVTVAAFAQAFARKHPGTEWAVIVTSEREQYRPPGQQDVAFDTINVGFMPLSSFDRLADSAERPDGGGASGDASGGDSEEWVRTGTGNSVSWLTADDPRLDALMRQSTPQESPSGTYPTYPTYPQTGDSADPQGYGQGYSQDGAYQQAP